jgi:hypothetical protein
MKSGNGISKMDYNAYLDTIDGSAAARVLSSIHRTSVGNDLEDYVTPLIKDGDPDTRREEVKEFFLSQLPLTRYPWLRTAEEEQASKIGSYSQQLPYSERMVNVHAYFAPNHGNPDLDVLRAAVRMTQDLMPVNLNPLSLLDAVNQMPKGTNLGAPFFTSDKRYIPHVYQMAEQLEAHNFEELEMLPALMFFRGQPRGTGLVTKNRTVWGVSHITIAHGLRVQRPLLEHLKQRVEFSAWNTSDIIDRAVTHAFSVGKQQIISVDFSGYDSSLHPLLMESCWGLIRRSFNGRHAKLIDWLAHQMRSVPLITPEGILLSENHAMPSGDANTNLIDGLAQIILVNYLSLKLGLTVSFVTVQGDDGIWIFNRPVDTEQIREIIKTDFGMTLSTEKGGVSPDEVHFLQNVYHRYYHEHGINRRVRPMLRVVNGMLSYERLVKKSLGWSGYTDTMRWWQQAENCKYHPRFDVLVQYLWDNDRYSKLDYREVVRLAGGVSKVASALKQSSFPYGKEPLSAVGEFRIVQELNKLRLAANVAGHQE